MPAKNVGELPIMTALFCAHYFSELISITSHPLAIKRPPNDQQFLALVTLRHHFPRLLRRPRRGLGVASLTAVSNTAPPWKVWNYDGGSSPVAWWCADHLEMHSATGGEDHFFVGHRNYLCFRVRIIRTKVPKCGALALSEKFLDFWCKAS